MREQFFSAIQSGDADMVRRFLTDDPALAEARDDEGISALLKALYHRQPAIASSILERTPVLDVFDAAATGDRERIRELLDHDPSLVIAYSPDGWTALHLAAFFGHTDVADLLIDRGAGIDMLSTSMGNTPLQAATANGQSAVVKRLIERGADAHYAIAQGGFTALHGAANGGHVEIVRMLLEAGADPDAMTIDGRSARDLAASRNHADVVDVLDEHSSRGDTE